MGQLTTFQNKNKGYSFSKTKLNRGCTNKVMNTPGPGHYKSDKLFLLKKTQQCVIPKAKKDIFNNNTLPGVGQYDPDIFWKKDNKKGYTISKNKRFQSLGVNIISKKHLNQDHIRIIMIQLK